MKKVVLLIGIVIVLAIGYLAAGPYLTVSTIKDGIIEQDPEKLSRKIDFHSLRQNLKEQIHTALMKSSAKDMKNNPLSAFTAGLTTSIAERIVDAFVTPSGLATLMEGKTPTGNEEKGKAKAPRAENLFKNARFSYDSISEFSIWVPHAEEKKEIGFIFHRDGLSWMLVNLVIPVDEQK